MIKFITKKHIEKKPSTLLYREEEYSFDTEPLHDTGGSSIMINDLQLEIDHEGGVLYVWGLCPLIEYQETDRVPHNYKASSLIAILDKPPTLGISYRLNEHSRWPIFINKKKGWVCIGTADTHNKNMVEFAPGCVATMNGQKLIALWLHPTNLPDGI